MSYRAMHSRAVKQQSLHRLWWVRNRAVNDLPDDIPPVKIVNISSANVVAAPRDTAANNEQR
jgi:hypothetical protein